MIFLLLLGCQNQRSLTTKNQSGNAQQGSDYVPPILPSDDTKALVPVSCTLSVTPNSIQLGQSATLTLRVFGDGISNVDLNGEKTGQREIVREEKPLRTSEYIAKVSGPLGEVYCQATLEVTFEPLSAEIWFSHNSRHPGEEVEIQLRNLSGSLAPWASLQSVDGSFILIDRSPYYARLKVPVDGALGLMDIKVTVGVEDWHAQDPGCSKGFCHVAHFPLMITQFPVTSPSPTPIQPACPRIAGSSSPTCFSPNPVFELYRGLLAREALAHEPAPWLQKIVSGQNSLPEVIESMRSSQEYLGRAPSSCKNSKGDVHTYTLAERRKGALLAEDLNALYRTFFWRYPDLSGLHYYVSQLLGCPLIQDSVLPRSIDEIVSNFHTQPEFKNGTARFNALPIEELYLRKLGRSLLANSSPQGGAYWVGRLTGQEEPLVNTTLLLPFTLWLSGIYPPSTIPAMLFHEIESNPGGGRKVAGTPVGNGFEQSIEYLNNGQVYGETAAGLFRTVLGRIPLGPYPSSELLFISKLLAPPYSAPPAFIASLLKATKEFASLLPEGCGCEPLPIPFCRFEVPTSVPTGQPVALKLHVLVNLPVTSDKRIGDLNASLTNWNPSLEPGTLTSIYWEVPHPIGKGENTITRPAIAGAPGSVMSGTASVSGPGGTSNCSYSIKVSP